MHRRPIRASALLRPRRVRLATVVTVSCCVVLAAAAALAAPRASPQPESPPSGSATLASFEWLAGSWRGSIGEDRVEESWMPPVGGAMAGLFRWSKGGRVYLYELLTLEEADGGLVLKLKHFGPGLVGWEDKAASVVFDLAGTEDGRAMFEKRGGDGARIVYRRTGETSMTASFQEKGGPELVFEYARP